MNYKTLLQSVSTNTQKTAEEVANLKSQSAVNALPLAVGMVIAFPTNLKSFARTIGGRQIESVCGCVLDNENDNFDETKNGVIISLAAFGRHVIQYSTQTVITPESIALEADANVDKTKLVYNNIKELTLFDIPNYLAGKKVKIVALASVPRENKLGKVMLNTDTTQPIVQDVTAFYEL